MSELIKDIKQYDGVVIVCATGELTFEKSPEFHKSLVEVCVKTTKHLVVDLSEVSHIDSSGVGTLTEIFQRMNRMKSKLSLVSMGKMVRGVFEITKLDRVFSIYETQEEALNS